MSHGNEVNRGLGRRRFLNRLWMALGGVALAELLWVIFSFLRPRGSVSKGGGPGESVAAGRVEDFAPGTVTAFQRGKFYLVRLEDGGFLAVSRSCTHLGCTVPWVEDRRKFVCPCHASAFDIKGSVVNSPAPRAMDLLRLRIENNVLIVYTGMTIRRSEFREVQVVYPRRD